MWSADTSGTAQCDLPRQLLRWLAEARIGKGVGKKGAWYPPPAATPNGQWEQDEDDLDDPNTAAAAASAGVIDRGLSSWIVIVGC